MGREDDALRRRVPTRQGRYGAQTARAKAAVTRGKYREHGLHRVSYGAAQPMPYGPTGAVTTSLTRTSGASRVLPTKACPRSSRPAATPTTV